MKSFRVLAIAEGLAVSLIWASSPVVIKIGLGHLGPLTLAGLRYFIAFLLLLPLMVKKNGWRNNPAPGYWLRLFFMGLCAYTFGNGALFWGLQYVPATTGSLILSMVPLPVLLSSILWLQESPTWWQVIGLVVTLGGSILFFSPGSGPGEPLGIAALSAGVVAFAGFSILGREVARGKSVHTLPLTTIPLGFGGGLLLAVAPFVEGTPYLSPASWGIVLWLAVVNTAIGYLLHNHALQELTALELNVLLNLAPLATALLAWLLLGEWLTPVQMTGMVTVIAGVFVVQWRKRETEA